MARARFLARAAAPSPPRRPQGTGGAGPAPQSHSVLRMQTRRQRCHLVLMSSSAGMGAGNRSGSMSSPSMSSPLKQRRQLQCVAHGRAQQSDIPAYPHPFRMHDVSGSRLARPSMLEPWLTKQSHTDCLCAVERYDSFPYLLTPRQGDAGAGAGKAVSHRMFDVHPDMPLSSTPVLFTLMQNPKLTCSALCSASSTASCSLACCPWNSSSILFLQGGQTAVVMQQGLQQSQDSFGTTAAGQGLLW